MKQITRKRVLKGTEYMRPGDIVYLDGSFLCKIINGEFMAGVWPGYGTATIVVRKNRKRGKRKSKWLT